MVTFTRESLLRANLKDMGFINGRTKAFMKDPSKKESDKAKANGNHTMVMSLKESM
jgi:hypothetical protein